MVEKQQTAMTFSKKKIGMNRIIKDIVVIQGRPQTKLCWIKKINGQQGKVLALDFAVLDVVRWDIGLTSVENQSHLGKNMLV
jgi:hypothetical protein